MDHREITQHKNRNEVIVPFFIAGTPEPNFADLYKDIVRVTESRKAQKV